MRENKPRVWSVYVAVEVDTVELGKVGIRLECRIKVEVYQSLRTLALTIKGLQYIVDIEGERALPEISPQRSKFGPRATVPVPFHEFALSLLRGQQRVRAR